MTPAIDEPVQAIPLMMVAAVIAGLGVKYAEKWWPDLNRALSPEYRGLLLGKVMGNVLEMGLVAVMALGVWVWWRDVNKPTAEGG